MSIFAAFSKKNRCPLCDGGNDCRYSKEDPDFIQCHGNVGASKGEKINGYVCVKEQTNGHTASFTLDNSEEWNEENRRQQLNLRRLENEKRERERQESFKSLLPITERDEQYRSVIDQLPGLSHYHHHKALHKKRGLMTDEILFAYEQGWIRTWQPGMEVKGDFSNLAGVNPDTNTLTGVGGISIAATNGEGHITGFQIATDNREKYPKYIWLSSKSKGGSPPNLTNSELPLFIWRHPEATEITETWLIEGGLKSLIVALILWFRLGRRDIQVIGAAGGNFQASASSFKAGLKVQTSKTVRLFPDGGAVYNQAILNNYKKAIDIATGEGLSVCVGWWGQFTKAKNDIDELRDFNKIDFLTTVEFFELTDSPIPNSENNPDSNLPKLEGLAFDQWHRRRKYTPDIVINQAEFSFGNIPKSGVVVAGKSGLGTAKTKAMIAEIKSIENQDKGAIILGYRNNLLIQTGERAKAVGTVIYHIHQDDDAKLMVADEASHHMMCLDSIKHIDGYFKGRDIYLDETCSVLLHAVTGGTLGDEQAKALRMFTQAIHDCDRIFLLDGNLADIHVDCIAKLASNKRIIKIENKQKIPAHNITFIDGIDEDGEIKAGDRSPLIKFFLQPDVKPWIFCDSKERTKVLYKLLTESGKQGYVLNSETTCEDWAKDFLANQNRFIETHKPDFIILSPSGDSGLSCTLNGYFTHKFSFFAGVLRTNSQHQAMFRLRDNTIPHYVFCPNTSNIRIKSTPITYIQNKLKQIADEQIALSAKIACESADSAEMAQVAIASAIARQHDDWWNLSHTLSVIDNYEIDNYKACLIHALIEAGHNVNIEEWEISGTIKGLEKNAKIEIRQQHAKEIFNAIEFPTIEEANKKAKAGPDKDTQRRIEKTRLLDRLPGIQDSEVWSDCFIYNCYIEDHEFIRQQERYWLLSNYEISQKRHESSWNHVAFAEDFFGRRVSNMGHDTIWALRELGLLSFTQSDKEYHKDSHEVVGIVETLRTRADIRLALRINHLEPESEDSGERFRILNNLLSLIGFKTKYTRKPNIETLKGKIRVRLYAIVPTVERTERDTPPPNYIDKPGCVPPEESLSGQDYSQLDPLAAQQDTPPLTYIDEPGCVPTSEVKQFDLKAARQAILDAFEYKYTKWMESNKSQVSWAIEPTAESYKEEESAKKPADDVLMTEEKLQAVADDLAACENSEMLWKLRQHYPVHVLKAAARKLIAEIKNRILSWVKQQNLVNQPINPTIQDEFVLAPIEGF
ncbi:hypothetical protein DSM106972_097400 [Dulcicalothrix desertica PCC 7102]|uniref:Replication origin-binding protein domain-containing protein n=1 Tax=Dulcicalothrix desertica PCC 7102 TaxID=232991 RepID=A0A3S1A3L2_9CYAN|nr:plasmid replication protein, CyRepA1 family [Dulcicalothrix desertica]RUS93108.1 hypothetical protein DSM106972_097400 [Dulcicalothrix desertica PCC 7102]TWH61183.1 hypothetical protein CAL7102_01038 [Dulcicalothrix desertica PCC 7102]